MAWRESRPVGRDYLELVTELLQRRRRVEPVGGLWEAADLQWSRCIVRGDVTATGPWSTRRVIVHTTVRGGREATAAPACSASAFACPADSGSVRAVAGDDPLIIQFAQGAAVERQLRADPPPSVSSGAAVLDAGPADDRGALEPPAVGQVVLSVPSPEALRRQADDVRRVIDEAGGGDEPLVVVVEAADELREDELAPVVDAARRSRRSVILRVAADG